MVQLKMIRERLRDEDGFRIIWFDNCAGLHSWKQQLDSPGGVRCAIGDINLRVHVRFGNDWEQALVGIFSHPKLRIRVLSVNFGRVAEEDTNVNHLVGAMRAIRQLCQFSGNHLKVLTIALEDISMPIEFVQEFHDGVLHPNCKVATLDAAGITGSNQPLERLLVPLLQTPTSTITTLSFDGASSPRRQIPFGDQFLPTLMNDPRCQIRRVHIHSVKKAMMDLAYLRFFRESRLEELSFAPDLLPSSIAEPSSDMRWLARHLTSPGNKIRALDFSLCNLQQCDISLLTEAMQMRECVLEELVIQEHESDLVALSHMMRRAQNNLKALKIAFPRIDKRAREAFVDAVTNSNCKLEQLHVRYSTLERRHGPFALAHGLESMETVSTLKVLTIRGDVGHSSSVFARALLSLNTRLTRLTFENGADFEGLEDLATLGELYRAALQSPYLIRLSTGTRFCDAFNSSWFRVMLTLLSVKSIRGLFEHPLADLPIRDLLPRMAAVLDWPLHWLQVNQPRHFDVE